MTDKTGIGTLDAAARLGIRPSVVLELRKLGYLAASRNSPRMIDKKSFEQFLRRYIAPHHYAQILECNPSFAGRRLADLGVNTIRLVTTKGASRLVERASARRVLGLSSDPDTIKDGSVDAFVEGLCEQLRSHTTFRLSSRQGGLTFRTGKGTMHLTATIDWVGDRLKIGPKYNKRKSAGWTAELLQRRKRIDTAFGGSLNWVECEDSLYVFKSMKRVPFKSASSWPDIYAEIADTFQQFKIHFEPPQRRY